MKYIVWLKEKRGGPWETNGDGPLTRGTADRIARDIRHMTVATAVLPVGTLPPPPHKTPNPRTAHPIKP